MQEGADKDTRIQALEKKCGQLKFELESFSVSNEGLTTTEPPKPKRTASEIARGYQVLETLTAESFKAMSGASALQEYIRKAGAAGDEKPKFRPRVASASASHSRRSSGLTKELMISPTHSHAVSYIFNTLLSGSVTSRENTGGATTARDASYVPSFLRNRKGLKPPPARTRGATCAEADGS
jgi:hypothetical protein